MPTTDEYQQLGCSTLTPRAAHAIILTLPVLHRCGLAPADPPPLVAARPFDRSDLLRINSGRIEARVS